jgi:hypothetical protein
VLRVILHSGEWCVRIREHPTIDYRITPIYFNRYDPLPGNSGFPPLVSGAASGTGSVEEMRFRARLRFYPVDESLFKHPQGFYFSKLPRPPEMIYSYSSHAIIHHADIYKTRVPLPGFFGCDMLTEKKKQDECTDKEMPFHKSSLRWFD